MLGMQVQTGRVITNEFERIKQPVADMLTLSVNTYLMRPDREHEQSLQLPQ